jgi:alkylation response protein AidB-like acyl-CoA dehydrogenase
MDTVGNRAAAVEISAIKVAVPNTALRVLDRAIQVHGAAGVSDDTVLARLYGWHRAMRLFDGPDEVHMRTIARGELGKEKSAFAAAVTG